MHKSVMVTHHIVLLNPHSRAYAIRSESPCATCNPWLSGYLAHSVGMPPPSENCVATYDRVATGYADPLSSIYWRTLGCTFVNLLNLNSVWLWPWFPAHGIQTLETAHHCNLVFNISYAQQYTCDVHGHAWTLTCAYTAFGPFRCNVCLPFIELMCTSLVHRDPSA